MNCIIIDDDAIQNTLIEEYLKEIDGINCVGVFNNPIDFLKVQDTLNFKFIILDMEMPKMSGVDLLNSFDKSNIDSRENNFNNIFRAFI